MPNLYELAKRQVENIDALLTESETKRIYNLSIPHLALLLAFRGKPFLIVENSPESALALYNDIHFWSAIFPILTGSLHFPPSSSPEAVGERARVLREFRKASRPIITSEEALRTGFRQSEIEGVILTLRKGDEMPRERLRERLQAGGYRSVGIVMEKGEYSERGWLFDIWPVTEEQPSRVELFGDEIDLIRTFDVETQRSTAEIDKLDVFPASEGDPDNDLLRELPGITGLDIFSIPELPDFSHPGLVAVSHLPFAGEGIDSMERSFNGLRILPDERKGIEYLPAILGKADKKVIAILPSFAQAERLREILFDGGVVAPMIDRMQLKSYEGDFCISTGSLSGGINLPGLFLLTDRELFGERLSYRPVRKSKVSRLLLSMEDLKPGDFVVHKDHGIGRFTGLQRRKTDDSEEDLITIDYMNGKLYVPFHSIGRLQRYSAGEGHVPQIDKLGGKSWEKTKKKVGRKVREMADKLLSLYAERSVSRGFVFSEDTPMHREFDDFFPYEETPDQINAFRKILEHMHSDRPMDMLLCGDVGYGKTEVAIKAAFRAVFDGKQVAVLVPTTLLAEQHFRTFSSRFSVFPVNIDYLSRFKSREDVKKCITAVANGEIDIVIGTHMLLNKKVLFHDLGLLIIDEEHRFGVAQKERLKELKKGADVLTLTATPIPRTLQMSLSGVREMSTIETPPEERLAVKSVVTAFSDRIIKEAIERELRRDGQAFFVHNRIRDIDKTAIHVKKLVPEARISVAHGRMAENQLERIMLDFLHRKTNVLVCTAIIGSGLDIPTANTIIIDRADTFGLSDLYQLRGRVGRGNTQAYSYLLVPGEDIITGEARKRLQALQEMGYLGAGFRLALKDLEIRGAGNLLGAEQSGYIHGVGFDMYMEMLEKAVAELKGEEISEEIEPRIRLHLSAFIPEDYIFDITLRLSMYKRISTARTLEALADIFSEMRDRFGPAPAEAENLIHVMKIKIFARRLYVSEVFDTNGRYRFIMVSDTHKTPEDFFGKLIRALSGLQASNKEGVGVRFLKDGFELDATRVQPADILGRMESYLADILKEVEQGV